MTISKSQKPRSKPTSISHIGVEKLFGYYTYDLPETKQQSENLERFMILYGDNGSGKTTILRLIFSLLTPQASQGAKTFIARTPFKRFAITLNDKTIVSAQKNKKNLLGDFTVEIRRPRRKLYSLKLLADSENSIKTSENPNIDELHDRLHDLGVTLYFLSDNRKIQTSLKSEFEEEERLRFRRHAHLSAHQLTDYFHRGRDDEDLSIISLYAEQADLLHEVCPRGA